MTEHFTFYMNRVEKKKKFDKSFSCLVRALRGVVFFAVFLRAIFVIVFIMHFIIFLVSISVYKYYINDVMRSIISQERERRKAAREGTSWAKTLSLMSSGVCVCESVFKMETLMHIIWHDYFAHLTGFCVLLLLL